MKKFDTAGIRKISGKKIILAIVCLAIAAFTIAMLELYMSHEKEAAFGDKQVKGVQIMRLDSGSVKVKWNEVEDASKYEVFRSTDNRDSYRRVGVVEEPSLVDKNCNQQTIFYYKIQAINNYGQTTKFSKDIASGDVALKIPVFAYHRFCSEIPWSEMGQGDYLFTDEAVFDQEMKYLADNDYRTITTEELYKWHEGEINLPRKTVMITMDDGNLSVYLYALPILEKYDLKATTFMIGHSTYDVTDYEPYDTDSYHHMGIDLMKEIQAKSDNLEFQSHTYDMHRSIGGERAAKVLPKEDFAADLKYMHETYGYTSVAYPFGEYDEKVIEALEEDGNYNLAFTYGEDGYATRDVNRFKIPRIKVYGNHTVERFIKWLQ